MAPIDRTSDSKKMCISSHDRFHATGVQIWAQNSANLRSICIKFGVHMLWCWMIGKELLHKLHVQFRDQMRRKKLKKLHESSLLRNCVKPGTQTLRQIFKKYILLIHCVIAYQNWYIPIFSILRRLVGSFLSIKTWLVPKKKTLENRSWWDKSWTFDGCMDAY